MGRAQVGVSWEHVGPRCTFQLTVAYAVDFWSHTVVVPLDPPRMDTAGRWVTEERKQDLTAHGPLLRGGIRF